MTLEVQSGTGGVLLFFRKALVGLRFHSHSANFDEIIRLVISRSISPRKSLHFEFYAPVLRSTFFDKIGSNGHFLPLSNSDNLVFSYP